MSNTLKVFGETYTGVNGIKAYTPNLDIIPFSPSMDDPIRFFDYDGTLLASYKSVPSTLPPVPTTHEKLTNGSWNYTAAEIALQFNAMGTCDVGANYDTVSGATEIDVEFVDSLALGPYLRCAVNGTVTVDWGDGSATETFVGTGLTTRLDKQHTYPSVGSYTIKLTPATGTTYAMYTNASRYRLLNANTSTTDANSVYSSCVKNVRVGSGCVISNNAFSSCYSIETISLAPNCSLTSSNQLNSCYLLKFIAIPRGNTIDCTIQTCYSITTMSLPYGITEMKGKTSLSSCERISIPATATTISSFSNCTSMKNIRIPNSVTEMSNFSSCYALKSITLPSGLTSLPSSCFNACSSLESIDIPSTVTSIGYGAFSNCYSLRSIALPQNLTTISANKGTTTSGCFQNCYNLASITIPAGVTEITSYDFGNCYGMKEYHFLRIESVPTLTNTNAFQNIPADCKIYVPASKLTDYQTAENWSTYASYMVGE